MQITEIECHTGRAINGGPMILDRSLGQRLSKEVERRQWESFQLRRQVEEEQSEEEQLEEGRSVQSHSSTKGRRKRDQVHQRKEALLVCQMQPVDNHSRNGESQDQRGTSCSGIEHSEPCQLQSPSRSIQVDYEPQTYSPSA